MKDLLIFLEAYLISAVFNITWFYIVTKFNLMKRFVNSLFVNDDGTIADGLKGIIITPLVSFIPTVVILAGITLYVFYYPIKYLILMPYDTIMNFLSKVCFSTIEKNAAKNIFKEKIMGNQR
jgi:hypothetical protein